MWLLYSGGAGMPTASGVPDPLASWRKDETRIRPDSQNEKLFIIYPLPPRKSIALRPVALRFVEHPPELSFCWSFALYQGTTLSNPDQQCSLPRHCAWARSPHSTSRIFYLKTLHSAFAVREVATAWPLPWTATAWRYSDGVYGPGWTSIPRARRWS